MKNKLFLISQSKNGAGGAATQAVVAAASADQARHMDPVSGQQIEDWDEIASSWAQCPAEVDVRYLGEAADDVEQGVYCTHFDGS